MIKRYYAKDKQKKDEILKWLKEEYPYEGYLPLINVKAVKEVKKGVISIGYTITADLVDLD